MTAPQFGGILSNSSNVVIAGGSFTISSVVDSQVLYGWKTFTKEISYDVFHDSAIRHGALMCTEPEHEHIRAKIIDLILDDAGDISSLLWVFGSSHTSSIAQTTADTFTNLGLSPMSYFFAPTSNPDTTLSRIKIFAHQLCNSPSPHYASFIPGISYQLCRRIPELREIVSRVAQADPAVMARNPSSQVHPLMITPLTAHLGTSREHSPRLVLIIDAPHILTRTENLSVGRALRDIVEQFPSPICVAVFSRPSSALGQAFDSGSSMTTLTKVEVPTTSGPKPTFFMKKYLRVHN